MPLIIEVPDISLEYLSSEAKEELKNSLISYSKGIIQESGRIEATIRNGDNNRPEITRQFIQEAVAYQKNPYRRVNTSNKYKGWQLISSVSILLSGIMFDPAQLQSSFTVLIFFILILAVAIVSTSALVFVGRDEQ